MSGDVVTCPVWCNGEHAGLADVDTSCGWFHDSSRDVLDPAGGDGSVEVGVSRYVSGDGPAEEADAVEVSVERSGTRMTPAEARHLADMLYIAADMAESTSTGAQS